LRQSNIPEINKNFAESYLEELVQKNERTKVLINFMVLFGSALQFLGAFAKFIKAIITIVMSVCSSVRMKQHFSYWTEFHEI
jgi:hypothetical protein